MKYRPIIFSGESVRAILEGRKTQTRRVVMPQPRPVLDWIGWITDTTWGKEDIGKACWAKDDQGMPHLVRCPYGVPSDRLWVRETWGIDPNDYAYSEDRRRDFVIYRAENQDVSFHWGWGSPLFMPRWASRLTLEIVSIRVEQLKNISEADAIAEGMESHPLKRATWSNRQSFALLWEELNAKRGYSWNSNPWVWAIEFRKVEDNL